MSDYDETVALPLAGTAGCIRYVREWQRISDYIHYVAFLAVNIDQMRRIAKDALEGNYAPAGGEVPEEGAGRLVPGVAVKGLRRYALLLLQTAHARYVDNYLSYVAELLKEVFLTRPEALRSSEQVRTDFILGHDSMDDLIEALAERRVERLSYQGMTELSEALRKEMGFELFPPGDPTELAVRIVEDRNLIVHNRGVINTRYLARVRGCDLPVGAELRLDLDALLGDASFLTRAVLRTDDQAIGKWGLMRSALRGPIEGEDRVALRAFREAVDA